MIRLLIHTEKCVIDDYKVMSSYEEAQDVIRWAEFSENPLFAIESIDITNEMYEKNKFAFAQFMTWLVKTDRKYLVTPYQLK